MRRCGTASLLGVAGLLALMSPAAAHDTLLASEPESGGRLEAPPETVILTYSSDVEVGLVQAAVAVPGSDLAPLPPASLSAAGPVLSVDVRDPAVGAPAGTWLVVVRVVSSDGHPVESSIDFEAGPGPTGWTAAAPGSFAARSGAPGPAASEAADPDASAEGTTRGPASTTPAPTTAWVAAAQVRTGSDEGSSNATWAALGIVAAVVVSGVVVVILARRG